MEDAYLGCCPSAENSHLEAVQQLLDLYMGTSDIDKLKHTVLYCAVTGSGYWSSRNDPVIQLLIREVFPIPAH